MNTHSKLGRFVVFLAILLSQMMNALLGATDSSAVCHDDPSAGLAFVGTLTELAAEGVPQGRLSARFRIVESLQGQPPDVVTTLMTKSWCRDSAPVPVIGRAYLVITHSSPGGQPWLEHCDQMRPVEDAAADLAYLRSSQLGTTPTEISGAVKVEIQGYPWKEIPISNATIRLAGRDQKVDLLSDENGQFHADVLPGKYSITAELPIGYDAAYGTPPAVTALEHRCTRLIVSASPTASFTAHLVDADGKLVDIFSNVQLTLETVRDRQFVRSVWPDENSELKADHLFPGKYILGLNTYIPALRSSAPYPPIYYPGVSRRSDAQQIEIAAGEHKVLPEMRIREGKGCEFQAIVIDKTGKPSRSAAVGLAYEDYANFTVGDKDQTNESGQQMMYAVFPGPVVLRAEKARADGSADASKVVKLNSCPTKPVVLRLNHTLPHPPEADRQH